MQTVSRDADVSVLAPGSASFLDMLGTLISGNEDIAASPEESRALAEPSLGAAGADIEGLKADTAPDMYAMSKMAAAYGMNQLNVGRLLVNSFFNRRFEKSEV